MYIYIYVNKLTFSLTATGQPLEALFRINQTDGSLQLARFMRGAFLPLFVPSRHWLITFFEWQKAAGNELTLFSPIGWILISAKRDASLGVSYLSVHN